MSFIENIFLFFKKLFNKKDDIKMIEPSFKSTSNQDNPTFVDSIKINSEKKHDKNKIETPIYPGNGLGIKNKISF